MSRVWKCDICGKYEPRMIRRIIAKNPDVQPNSALNKSEYYAFNLFCGDFCDECLDEIERAISHKIFEMRG